MELTRQALIDRVQSKVTSIEDFNYDKLVAPPLSMLLSTYDIDALYNIATSIRYSGNPQLKYNKIDEIMKARGFVKLSAGTNRIVYRHLESTDFVVKVAADAIGIHDNPKEFENQFIFKPFVTKVFEVSPCGTVGVFERVNPITSREEFLSVADDIYDVINEWFIGKYVLADIGTKFFMNWGIRTYSTGKEGSVAFGPVLLDFPYVYELDGNKLYCSAVDHNSETGKCGGVIDYDDGFNFLRCTKCGVRYRVKELSKKIKNNEIIIYTRRESKKMKIGHYENGKIVCDDLGLKAPAKKVSVAKPAAKTGTLSINMDKVRSHANNVQKEEVEEKPATPVNNPLRSNPASSRGMVKAPTNTNIKTTLTKEEEDNEAVQEAYREIIENKEYNTFVSYDAEYDILTLSNGENEITTKLYGVIPDDEKQNIVEASDEYAKLEDTKNKLNESKKQIKELKAQIKELEATKNETADNSEVEALKKQIENLIKEKEELKAEKDKEIANWIKASESATSSYDDTLKAKDILIKEQKKLIEDLEKELAFEPEASQPVEPVVKVIKGIPVKHNEEYVDDSSKYYGDAVVLHGVVERINGFTSPEDKEENRQVVVFPTDEENGEYLADVNQNIIVLGTINGYMIDDLMEAAEEIKAEKAKKTEE